MEVVKLFERYAPDVYNKLVAAVGSEPTPPKKRLVAQTIIRYL